MAFAGVNGCGATAYLFAGVLVFTNARAILTMTSDKQAIQVFSEFHDEL